MAYALAGISLIVATKETTAANAIILHYSAPAIVFLLAIPMLREIPFLLPWVLDSLWLVPCEIGLMIIMGIFQLGLHYVMYTFNLRRLIARDAALTSLVKPLLNPT